MVLVVPGIGDVEAVVDEQATDASQAPSFEPGVRFERPERAVLRDSGLAFVSNLTGGERIDSVEGDLATEKNLPLGSTVVLPDLWNDGKPTTYNAAEVSQVSVPVFDDHRKHVGFVEGLSWRGASDNGVVGLVFVVGESGEWRFGRGYVHDNVGQVSKLTPQGADIVVEQFAPEGPFKPGDEHKGEEDRAQSAPHDTEALEPEGLVAPQRLQNVGTARIDVLAVGFNHPDRKVSPETLLERTLAGRNSLHSAFERSSTSSWNIDGITLNIRGLMIVQSDYAVLTTYSDLNRLESTGIKPVADALGVDVTVGFRDDYSDACGRARWSTFVMVWQQDNGGPGGCQDDESYTFAHEFGHVLGADHSRASSTSGDELRTIMSTPSGENRILNFSNPHVSWPGPFSGDTGDGGNNANEIADRTNAVVTNGTYVPPSGGRYTAIEEPVRVLDTRSTAIGGYASLTTTARQISVATAEMPAGATHVAINVVTLTSSGDEGGLKFTATAGLTQSTATQPAMLFKPIDTRAQTVVVPLSIYRTIWVATTTDLIDTIVDVVGYFGPTGAYLHALDTPVRVNKYNLSAGSDNAFNLASACPSDTQAVFANITTVSPAVNGHVTARAYGSPVYTAYSTVNYAAGKDSANATFVKVNNQRISIRTSQAMPRMIVDVTACLRTSSSGGDTYSGYARPSLRLSTTMGRNATRSFSVAGGSGVTALTSIRVTDHQPSGGWLVAYDVDTSQPPTSNINPVSGDYTSNSAVTGSGNLGGVNKTYLRRDNGINGNTTVSVVQMGYFS